MSVIDTFSLAGKTAVVTGGAGRYGRQIVRALAEVGATVYAASRNVAPLEMLAEELAAEGLTVNPRTLDQGDEASVLALRDAIQAERPSIDVLVNNAVLQPVKGYNDDIANFALSMQVNATGVFMVTRAFGDIMAAQGGGSIINIGSTKGSVGPDPTLYEGTEMHAWHADYFFHKGGMLNFTRFISSYYGSKNVRCNCISPGGFQEESHPDAFVQRYNDRTCLGRMANSTDLMGGIVFLASDASAYVTGANLAIDGGYTVR